MIVSQKTKTINKDEDNEEEIIEDTQEESNEELEEELVEELSVEQKLEVELNNWKTQYYKVFADMENTKKRMQNEHNNSLKFMMQSLMEELLPVIDNFERSLAVENPSKELKNFLKGYEMIYQQLLTVLEKQGVTVIDTKDKEFDPHFHQAVMTVKEDKVKPNMIVEELQKGYMLKDRVIRASLVKISE
mgnify:CR=1 FL=1